VKDAVRKITRRLGYDVVRYHPAEPDFAPWELDIIRQVRSYTMTSVERLYALIQAAAYVITNEIPGDFVECGVWRGGSMMAVAKTLLTMGAAGRDLYLFDTFEGMPAPGPEDVAYDGTHARDIFEERKRDEGGLGWCFSSLEEVTRAMLATGYDARRIHLVQGRVEETLPARAPQQIALLRLDTDWYESTRHELVHLFPRLSLHGVLIIDDYGHWGGARKATDEYLAGKGMLLNRIDYTGRIGVKV
jgi:O-methyltransferase